MKPWAQCQQCVKSGMAPAHTCNPNTWPVGVEEQELKNLSLLHSEFKATLSHLRSDLEST